MALPWGLLLVLVLFKVGAGQAQAPPTAGGLVVNDLDNLLQLVDAIPGKLEIEIMPGDKVRNPFEEGLVGDGIGEPLYYLPGNKLLPEELEATEDNMFLPLIFPRMWGDSSDRASERDVSSVTNFRSIDRHW